MQSTSQAFSYLRSKVREWKAGDLRPTRRNQSWERFQAIAPSQFTPIFEELLKVLEQEGIHATVRYGPSRRRPATWAFRSRTMKSMGSNFRSTDAACRNGCSYAQSPPLGATARTMAGGSRSAHLIDKTIDDHAFSLGRCPSPRKVAIFVATDHERGKP
jgi:hypothetical protein